VPTVLAHAVAALALGTAIHARRAPLRFWLAGAACALLPDADVIGYRLGVPYDAPLGHRGASHSLAFAAAVALGAAALLFRGPRPAVSRRRAVAFFFAAGASHGLLDAMTAGGLGIALFAPLSDARVFLPFRPIRVSPLELTEFFSERGLAALRSELLWVWVPALAFAAVSLRARRRPRPAPPPGTAR
jgi:inner membrane protein